MARRCVYPGCGATSDNQERKLKFFSFPRCCNEADIWLKRIQGLDGFDEDSEICQAHFRSSDILRTEKKLPQGGLVIKVELAPFSVPKTNLPKKRAKKKVKKRPRTVFDHARANHRFLCDQLPETWHMTETDKSLIFYSRAAIRDGKVVPKEVALKKDGTAVSYLDGDLVALMESVKNLNSLLLVIDRLDQLEPSRKPEVGTAGDDESIEDFGLSGIFERDEASEGTEVDSLYEEIIACTTRRKKDAKDVIAMTPPYSPFETDVSPESSLLSLMKRCEERPPARR